MRRRLVRPSDKKAVSELDTCRLCIWASLQHFACVQCYAAYHICLVSAACKKSIFNCLLINEIGAIQIALPYISKFETKLRDKTATDSRYQTRIVICPDCK